MRAPTTVVAAAWLLAQAPFAAAQDVPTAPTTDPLRLRYEGKHSHATDVDDYREVRLFGGFWVEIQGLGLEVRGTNALLLFDREGARAALEREPDGALPRRGIPPLEPRRRLSPEHVRERLAQSLLALGSDRGVPADPAVDRSIDLLRYLYFEGGVTVVRDGQEVLRCERLWISPVDDRVVVEDAELRYRTGVDATGALLIARGPKLTKQGGRWTGRDLTITTCTAGEPHIAVAVGEAEIIERQGEFEVIARGQRLQVSGTSVLPLPDAHIFTGSQSQFPIKQLAAGYSEKEGTRGGIVVGLPWNDVGGAAHEWLTGRPAGEFRGDWDLGVGWIEKRGVPLRAGADYRAKDVYIGRTEGFWLDDRGDDLREIVTNLDGSAIDAESRGIVRSRNRVFFGERTHLDLTAFAATDAAVYSEFFGGDYREAELPETSAYLHHADGNRLLTIGTRSNLTGFAYADSRALTDRFVEELPVVTYDWIAQPIGTTPWDTPIVVDARTELGQRRSDFDRRSTAIVSDRTFRADQLLEVSAPVLWGPLAVRPFASGRGTWYDHAADDDAEGRVAFEGGVQLGTRLSRTFGSDAGGGEALRHVMAPKITYANRFFVDDDPAEFRAFDANDQLTERNLLRVEVRNLLQRSEGEGKKAVPRDFVYLDLAQDVWPDANRDNGGDTLGLLYYDLLLRPRPQWLPVESLAIGVYGDHDWEEGLRTFDAELAVGRVLGASWTFDYRRDAAVDGAVGLSSNAQLLGRWDATGFGQYDVESDNWISYGFGVRRNDHDWSLAVTLNYDPFSDETTFRLDFTPRIPGLYRPKEDRFGRSHLQDTGMASQF